MSPLTQSYVRFGDRISNTYGGRPSYHTKFFEGLAKLGHNVSQFESLLDLCAGRGEVADGLSGFVDKVVAVEASVEMVRNKIHNESIRWINTDVNSIDLFDQLKGDSFDLVTAGRSIQYIEKNTLMKLRRHHMKPSSILITLQSGIANKNNWLPAYNKIKRFVFPEIKARVNWIQREKVVSAGYRYLRNVNFVYRDNWSLDRIYQLICSYSTYGNLITDREEILKNNLEKELSRYMINGKLPVLISNSASLYSAS